MRYLEGRGVFIEEIWQRLGLSKSELISSAGVMSAGNYLNILTWASDRLDEPLLGVRLVEQVNTSVFGIVGHLLRLGSSVREMFDFVECYNRIFSPDFDYSLKQSDGLAACIYHKAKIAGCDSRVDIYFGLSVVAKILQEFVGWRLAPGTLLFHLIGIR